jgi:hypothetical protein
VDVKLNMLSPFVMHRISTHVDSGDVVT